MTGNRTATNTCFTCVYAGGELGSIIDNKGTSRPKRRLDANDNAPLVMALSA